MVLKEGTQGLETNNNQDDNHVFAPPESSDEESEKSSTKPAARSPRAPKDEKVRTLFSRAKRSAGTAASSRSKRQKLTDIPSIDTIAPLPNEPTSSNETDLWGGMPSSSSQKRRHNVYKPKLRVPEPLEEEEKPREKKDVFKVPDAVELHTKAAPRTKFQRIDDVSGFSPVRKRTTRAQVLMVPDSPKLKKKPEKSEFRKFDLPDFPSSTSTENPSIPDIFDSPEKQSHKRSGSISSLSSVDEMYLLTHEVEFKEEVEDDLSGTTCPICEKVVHDSASLIVPENLQTLKFQQQQGFCTQHKIADAKEQWQRRHYPKKMYWEELEGFRIPEKIPLLKEVINRQAASFYLDELDAEIKAAKGNRSKLRIYLNEGVVDIAKAGYYGPKGARIMTNVVTTLLTETLNKASQSESALRMAGVGAYVSAVLVPELTLQLVMDDMKLKTAKEGRKVLHESTEIGVLLNPDDDQVHRDEAEED